MGLTRHMRSSLLVSLDVIVYTIDHTGDLIEADVVETFKTGSQNLPDSMIWDEKLFLPAHEYIFPPFRVLIV